MRVIGEICRRPKAMDRFFRNRRDDVRTRSEIARFRSWELPRVSQRRQSEPVTSQLTLQALFGARVVYEAKPNTNGNGHVKRDPVLSPEWRSELQEGMDDRFARALLNGSIGESLRVYGEKRFALFRSARVTKGKTIIR